MKKILFLSLMFVFISHISAQDLQLKGRVLSGNDCVEFANVLLQTKDSVFVTGGVTDEHGRFCIQQFVCW